MNSMKFDSVGWREFLDGFVWRQGEHLTIVKPTGGGKTTLLGQLLPYQRGPAVVVFVTKTYDTTIRKQFSRASGWHVVSEWPPPRYVSRVLLRPPRGKTIRETVAIQRRVFRHALDRIFLERGWTVVFDEEHYMCATLGFSPEVAMFYHQGRSSGLTVVSGIQRPKYVPLITFSSTTHAFIGNTTDRDDLKRLSDLGGINAKELEGAAKSLEFFEFLYIPARGKSSPVRTTVELADTPQTMPRPFLDKLRARREA